MAGRTEFLQNLSGSNGASLGASLPKSLPVNGLGPFPMARDVAFPGTDDQGELLLSIADVSVSRLEVTGARVDQAKGTMTLCLAATTLAGTYEVYGIEQPAIDLDIGGGLMPLTLLATGDGADATASDAPTLTEAQYDQLQQANNQKPKLSKTPQGRKLLSTYSTYNDDYNHVFQTNEKLRQAWVAGGATAAMAYHTSKAIAHGTTVNPEGQTFGSTKVTYNDNSFSQAKAVVTACIAASKGDAATAVGTFMGSVTSQTKNTQHNTCEMDSTAVFTAVSTAPDSAFNLEDPQHGHVVSAIQMIATGNHDDSHLSVLASYGCKPTDAHIQTIQAIHANGIARSQPETRHDLWTGPVGKALPAIDMTFELEDEPVGHLSCRLIASTLAIDTLDIDNSAWDASAAANIARDRITGARFLHGLAQTRVNTAIKQAVAKIVADQNG